MSTPATDPYQRLDEAVDDFEEGRAHEALRTLRAEAFAAREPEVLASIADLARQMVTRTDEAQRADFEELAAGVSRRLSSLPESELTTELLRAKASYASGDFGRAVEHLYRAVLETDEDPDEGRVAETLAAIAAFADSVVEELIAGGDCRAFDYARLAANRRQAALADESEPGDDVPATAQIALAAELADSGEHDESLQELRSAAFAAQERGDVETLEELVAVSRELATQLGEDGSEFAALADEVSAGDIDDTPPRYSVESLLRSADETFDIGDVDLTLEFLHEAVLSNEGDFDLDAVDAAAASMAQRVRERADSRSFEFVSAAVHRGRRSEGTRASAAITRPAPTRAAIVVPPPAEARTEERPQLGGWLVPIVFLGIVGGLLGWAVLHGENPRRANHVLKWGAIASAIAFGAVTLFYFVLLLIILAAAA